MPKANDRWTVLPHGPLVELAENLWCLEGELPGMPLKRRLTIARREGGGLVLHNPIALEEDLMKKVESLGAPELLVVPNGWHRLDCVVLQKRYPDAKLACPAGARKKVEEVTPVALTYSEIPPDGAVRFEHLEGVREVEGVMKVRSAAGTTLVFNDVLFNVPHLPGVSGLAMRLIGSTGGPKITRVARTMMVKDRARLRAHLERLAEDVVRLIPGHGAIVEDDAAGVLRAVAATL